MKLSFANASKLVAGVLLTAVVVSCNNEQPKTAATTGSTAEVKAADQIVFVNSDSLLNNYEYFKSIRTKFEQKSKKAQVDLNSKGTAFQREVAQYQQQANSMSADQRAATEERLARKQQELATFNQNAGNALASEQAAENEKLYNRVAEFLKQYAKEKGFKMVLTYQRGNPTLLYADEKLDVTKDVVTRLNEEYKKDNK